MSLTGPVAWWQSVHPAGFTALICMLGFFVLPFLPPSPFVPVHVLRQFSVFLFAPFISLNWQPQFPEVVAGHRQ